MAPGLPPSGQPEPGLAPADFVEGALETPADDAPAPPTDDADWLDRICPYLLSEDGTWRSTQPDAGHRCTAQDPPGTLPTAFQERFCLTDRHVRCEMYKYAQSARSTALEQEGIQAEQVQAARFKPSVRSVPLALGPSEGAGDGSSGGPGRRRLVLVAVAIGAAAIILFLIVVLSGGSGDSGTGPISSAQPTLQPTAAPTPRPTIGPTTAPTTAPTVQPEASVDPASLARVIRYRVQADEALLKIAETFGTTRRRILRANEGLADKRPFVEPGDVILVPIAVGMPQEDVEAAAGFVEFVDPS